MNPPISQKCMNHNLLIALAAVSIAAPGVIQSASAADPPDKTPMESMLLIPNADTNGEPKPIAEVFSNSTERSEAGAANLPNADTDRPPSVETIPMIELAPAGQTPGVNEPSPLSQPTQYRTVDRAKRDHRADRFNRGESANSAQPLYQPRPTYHANPVFQSNGTTPVNSMSATSYAVRPEFQQNGAAIEGTDRKGANDLQNERTGDLYIGFAPKSYVRRPKYQHRSGYGRDYRNIRTNEDFFGLPRHDGGQDLYDPSRGRVIYGFERRDGTVDYYDPTTGQLILTRDRRR